MSDNNTEWKVDQAEFQGFVKATLEEHNRKFDAIFGLFKENNRRVDGIKSDVDGLNVKAGFFGLIGGALISVPLIIKMWFSGR